MGKSKGGELTWGEVEEWVEKGAWLPSPPRSERRPGYIEGCGPHRAGGRPARRRDVAKTRVPSSRRW